MNRYSFSQVDKRWDGKRVFKSLTYPKIPIDNNDLYIITNESMKMDSLAFKYYKDPTLWWVIAQANNIGNGRLSVESGKQIRIPYNINAIISEFQFLNS
jgi:hypothetical protein